MRRLPIVPMMMMSIMLAIISFLLSLIMFGKQLSDVTTPSFVQFSQLVRVMRKRGRSIGESLIL